MKYIDTDGAGNVYFLNYTGSGGGPKMYKSIDGGSNFASVVPRVNTGSLDAYGLNATMVCVRGKPGHLLIARGMNFGTPVYGYLLWSQDSGANWTAISGTFSIWQVACGKAKPGATYPAVYITGTLTNGGAGWSISL